MAYKPKVKIVLGSEIFKKAPVPCPFDEKFLKDAKKIANSYETVIVYDVGNLTPLEVWTRYCLKSIVKLDHLVCCAIPDLIKSDYVIALMPEHLKNDGATRILIDAEDNRDIRDDVFAIYRVSDFNDALKLINRLEEESELY